MKAFGAATHWAGSFRGTKPVHRLKILLLATLCGALSLRPPAGAQAGEEFPRPYQGPRVEREEVYEFTAKPACKALGNDRYEISFAVKGACDVTVALIDQEGKVVRHLGAGVLGANAPEPFQKGILKQVLYWNGKDDLEGYVKEPERLQVQVRLGLKPEFERRLGGSSPYNIPGQIFGLAGDASGMYVWSVGKTRRHFLRKFDHEAGYLQSLLPPPASLPQEKLAGLACVEYEPGKRSVFSPELGRSLNGNGCHLPYFGLRGMAACQPVISQGRFYYANATTPSKEGGHTSLFFIRTDGSTELAGCDGLPLIAKGHHPSPMLAASPDGKWIYLTQDQGTPAVNVVWRRASEGSAPAQPFLGRFREPGAGDEHLGSPLGIDTDRSGRIYVCDRVNNRLQIFSPEGRFLKTVRADRPRLVSVHKLSGQIYLLHAVSVQGRSLPRITCYGSFEDPRPCAFAAADCTFLVVDSWSAKPRLWLGGKGELGVGPGGADQAIDGLEGFQNDYALAANSISIWEHDGEKIAPLMNFEERAKREDGAFWAGPWNGSGLGNKVYCDPLRETVCVGTNKFVAQNVVYDLRSGRPVRSIRFPGTVDDLSFDKKGYLHAHLDPGFHVPGVARFDPDAATPVEPKQGERIFHPTFRLREVPYDYGVESAPFYNQTYRGVLAVKDQEGAKFFQDGIGANMRGEVAEVCNIYYVPKLDEVGAAAYEAGTRAALARGEYVGGGAKTYADFLRDVQEREKKGESTYFLKREPGQALAGPTVWVFEETGELKTESAAIMEGTIQNCQLDEEGRLYLVSPRPRVLGKRLFLEGRGGRIGVQNDRHNATPLTGTLLKSNGGLVRLRAANAEIKLDRPPQRDPDLSNGASGESSTNWCWVEGAEWLYAGASPLVVYGVCTCPKQMFCLDWFKRSYVPEMYRYSIGILDTNGNLLLHLGQYGNFDDAHKLGLSQVRFLSATDNHLVYEDGGERLVVLRLNYHATETTPVRPR